MNKNVKKLAGLVAALSVVGSAFAYEFRAPLPTERGQLRYFFQAQDDDCFRIKTWSAFYCRGSHRAYTDDDCDNSQPLSALIFNESDFRLNKIFPDCKVPICSENYNPFMRVLKLHPRVTYEERGSSFGASVDFRVWEDKGRLGVRVHVPFRDIKMEREDDGDLATGSASTQDVVARRVGPLEFTTEGGVDKVVFSGDIRAYRLDLVEALPRNEQLEGMVDYEFSGDPGRVLVANNAMYEGIDLMNATEPHFVLVASPEDQNPGCKSGAVIDTTQGDINDQARPALTPLPANLNIDPNSIDKFIFDRVTPISYAGLSQDGNPNDAIATNKCTQDLINDRKAQLWVTTVHDEDGGQSTEVTQAVAAVENSLASFTENPFEWMHDKGFDFETYKIVGVGDIDVDLFYEHRFYDTVSTEVFLGIRIPSGRGSRYHNNPYRVQLGNGEHVEIKLGGHIAWEPFRWMNWKNEILWSFVLENEELRAASFKGAQIKNIGPCAQADVDWGYLVFNTDFHFYHPCDNCLSSMVGYQFYYKTEDNVHFKCKGGSRTAETWLGRKKQVVGDDTTQSIQFSDLEFQLDNCGLERNTERHAHRLRWETGYRLSDTCELYLGGSWTFAGKNMPKETDFYGGFTVRYQ